MRIALFDGLLEAHVPESLARALAIRGHDVLDTGKIGHGFQFESDPSRLSMINGHIDRVLEFAPDVVLVFRPASLPPRLLRRLRGSGAQLMAWLSDDPVLWNLSYRPVIDLYDVVLHCGAERVLRFYDEHFGRPVGVNFPFWTDNIAFPYVYRDHKPESTAMFLGNVQDGIRRKRYYALADLQTDVRVHGSVGLDFRNIGAGYLESNREVVDAASRARVAINIPQYFNDHAGEPTWFDGLAELGTFQYPSRVIQYAAMGLPIVSVSPTPEDYDTFPELHAVRDVRQIDGAVAEILSSPSAVRISRQVHRRFLRHFSAASRVMALESLTQDDSWKRLDASERARWFSSFDGQRSQPGAEPAAPDGSPQERINVTAPPDKSSTPMRIALFGDGWRVAASPLNVAHRAFEYLGHVIVPTAPHERPELYAPDKFNEFRGYIAIERLLDDPELRPDAVVLVGAHYDISASGQAELAAAGIPLVVHGLTNSTLNVSIAKLIDKAHVLSVTHPDLHNDLRARGFDHVHLIPGLLDTPALRAFEGCPPVPARLRVVGEQKRHITKHPHLYSDLVALGADFALVEDLPAAPESLDDLVEYSRSAVTIVPIDESLSGGQLGVYFPFALAAGGLVVTPRASGPALGGEPGMTHITARDKYELSRKLHRLREDGGDALQAYIRKGQEHVRESLLAEPHLESLLAEARFTATTNLDPQSTLQFPGSQVRRDASVAVKQSLAASQYRGSSLRVTLDRLCTRAHPAHHLVSLRVRLDSRVLATCPFSDLVEHSELTIDVPAGQALSAIAVELVAEGDLPFAPWRELTALQVSLEEHNRDHALTRLAVHSSSEFFRSPAHAMR